MCLSQYHGLDSFTCWINVQPARLYLCRCLYLLAFMSSFIDHARIQHHSYWLHSNLGWIKMPMQARIRKIRNENALKRLQKRLVDKYYCLEFDLRHANDGTRPCVGHWLWDWGPVCLETESWQFWEYLVFTIANCCHSCIEIFFSNISIKVFSKVAISTRPLAL